MLSKTKIWNMALSRLHQPNLVSPDDATPAAVACATHYDQCLDAVLRLTGWNCAKTRAVLARLTETPAFGWSYAYQLPADYIQLLALDAPTVRFVIEGDRLLCNASSCRIVYIRRLTDPARFSPGLTECLVLMLAAKLSPQLAAESGSGILAELYQTALPLARSADAWENRSGELRSNWTEPEVPPASGWPDEVL